MSADAIESISFNTLEDIGDAAFKAILPLLKEKGYGFVGGVSGGNEYSMFFKRDPMDIFGYEKPITLKLILPYAPEDHEHKVSGLIYSSIPERENKFAIEDYLDIAEATL
jgi:hypothetical protein